MAQSSIGMRKGADPADVSVPFQISWLTRNIRRKNHWRHWLLSPRYYVPLAPELS